MIISYPPESVFTRLSSAAFCSAVSEAIAATVNNTKENMATVAAVLNLLFSGYARAVLKIGVRVFFPR